MTRFLAGVAVAMTVLFFGLPVVALFLQVTPAALLAGLRTDAARSALLLSAETTLAALVVIVLAGTPVAYVLARTAFPGRSVLAAVLELPLVMPPAVAGISLLFAFGRRGTIGGPLGLSVPFTSTAVVLALIFVASPFYLRQAQASFRAIDPAVLEAARTCGASPMRVFTRIAAPLAAPGLATGGAVAWARALGEFGATLIFAGSLQGVTQTAPLAIYDLLGSDQDAALALSCVLVLAAVAVLLAVRLGAARWTTGS